MKYKRTILIMLFLFALISIGAVSATDNNVTDDVISTENDGGFSNTIDLDAKSSEITTDNNEILGLDEKSTNTTLNYNNVVSSQKEDVLGSSDSRKLTVKPLKTYSNKRFSYSVKLTNNNKPLSGQTVGLTVFHPNDECDYYKTVTDAKGIATFNVGAQQVGKYQIFVETRGIVETSYFTVIQNPKATIVKAPGITAKSKQNKYFKVYVKNYNGKPINNLKLKLKVLTKQKYAYYYIKTNSKGIAVFNTKGLTVGTHVVYVYSADGRYEVSKKSKIVIKRLYHYVKVGIYEGKLSDNQYKKLQDYYNNYKHFASVTINCINVKYHKITIEVLSGYSSMSDRYFKKGFYGDVWDNRYGIDGTKIQYGNVKFYMK